MELSRRDALAALAAAGATTAAGATLTWTTLRDDEAVEQAFDDRDVRTLAAVARTVYPSAVAGIPGFVERYVVGRVRDRPDYAAGMVDALGTLDVYAESSRDRRFADLSPDERDELLVSIGVADATPEPDGTDAGRIRYYLVNDLLYALYTTPTGGELVGLENPQGHPGGTGSYRRGPNSG
jgi:hypothetical protein